jgi:hypothetical protein
VSEGYDYPALLRAATAAVVREVLERAAREGLPGEHHFYLTFATRAPGVELSANLASRYPETMSVVLQHQYEDLRVDDESFTVTLRFGGSWERLRVSFTALTSFLDPSVPFGLDFTQFDLGAAAEAADTGADDEPGRPVAPAAPEPRSSGAVPTAPAVGEGAPPPTGDPGEPPLDGGGAPGGDLLPFRRP